LSIVKNEALEEKKFFSFSNSELSATFLDKHKPDSYMGDIISMFDKRLYKSWDKLLQALKTNKPIEQKEGGDAESIWNQAKSNQAIKQMQEFSHAMYGISVGPAIALTKAFDFSKYNKMMDIGGGPGVYAIYVVKDNPNMTATVLDLEPVCQVANQYITQFNLDDKIQTKALDFFKEELPKDCDMAFLSLIIHDYDEEKDISLLIKKYIMHFLQERELS
jgi:tRNA A22 N-methylase